MRQFYNSLIQKLTSRKFFSNSLLLNILLMLSTLFVSAFLSLWAFRESASNFLNNSISLNGDGALIGLFLKVALNNSYSSILQSQITTSDLGWPGRLDFADFPVGQLGEILIIKVFSQVTGIIEPGVLIHIFSIMKVIPISLAVIVLGRILKLNPITTSAIAIAYSISTYNLIRSEGHFFLGLTWTIPLGMAAIALAFQISENFLIERSKLHIKLFKILMLIVPVAVGTFYYSFFTCLLALSVFLILAIKQYSVAIHDISVLPAGKILRETIFRLSGFILIGITILLGALIQLGLNIGRGNKLTLTGLADRSPIESVIYGGTFEGYFFDSSQLILNLLKRQDLLNFAASRISWEGAQVGAFAGFAAYGFVFFCFYNLVRSRSQNRGSTKNGSRTELNGNIWLVSVLLFVSFTMYLIGPVNFGISRVFPEIRAWGRMSSFLTLLILIGVALVAEMYLKKLGAKALVTLLILIIPISEAYFFRSYRPVSSVASSIANATSAQRDDTLSELKTIYQRNCPIFLAPVYPFPEYERQDDSNFDYSQLALPLIDDGYFRWSAGAIKSTENSKTWQNLASVQPNFARASIDFQLDQARALGACGSVVDISLLVPSERNDFSRLLSETNSLCFHWLPGEIFENRSRFVNIVFLGPACTRAVEDARQEFASSNFNGHTIWQVDQPYGLNYLDKWQMFPNTAPINFRLITSDAPNKEGVSLQIKLKWKTGVYERTSTNLCLRDLDSEEKNCKEMPIVGDGEVVFPLSSHYLKNSITKLELSIHADSVEFISEWGLTLQNNN